MVSFSVASYLTHGVCRWEYISLSFISGVLLVSFLWLHFICLFVASQELNHVIKQLLTRLFLWMKVAVVRLWKMALGVPVVGQFCNTTFILVIQELLKYWAISTDVCVHECVRVHLAVLFCSSLGWFINAFLQLIAQKQIPICLILELLFFILHVA